jgi:hypothetical protein
MQKLMHAKLTKSVKMISSNLECRKVGIAMELMKSFNENLTYHLEIEDGAFGHELNSAELSKHD